VLIVDAVNERTLDKGVSRYVFSRSARNSNIPRINIKAWRRTIGIVALLLTACSPAQDASQLRPDDLDTVTQGKTIYRKHCAVCHGAALEGQPDWQKRLANGRLPAPPHDDSGHTWHHTDAVLISMTRLGPGKHIKDPNYASDMPAFEGVLSEKEIVAVLSYIKSTWGDEARQWNNKINAQ